MNHRVGRIVFGLAAGLAVAAWSYQWLVSPEKLREREEQERIVELARVHLADKLGIDDLEIVDPLAPERKVGKAYVFRSADGWEVSGYYRRSGEARWHDFLMSIAADDNLRRLKIRDRNDSLAVRALADPVLEVVP